MCAWVLADSIFFSVVEQSLIAFDGSKTVPLSIREVLLLDALLKNETDKRRLIEIVWPNTIVSDSSYHKLLFELRANLNLMGLPPTIIKTIPRRGCAINVAAVLVDESEIKKLKFPIYAQNVENSFVENEAEHDTVCSSEHVNRDLVTVVKPENSLYMSKKYNGKIFEVFFKQKYTVFFSVASIIFSLILFFVIVTLGEMPKYKAVEKTNKNVRFYSLNKSAVAWSDNVIDKSFSIGFYYADSYESVYFLCDKDYSKCENHVFLLH